MLWNKIKSDLYRYEGKCDILTFIRSFVLSHLGFRITVFYRIAHHFYRLERNTTAKLFSLLYRVMSKRFGVDIPYQTIIGYGLYMPHPFCIIVNGKSVLGNNCNLHQAVTIGEAGRGDKKGNPVIGDNIYIGPGAKIFGRIELKDNCAIGANCVLNRSTDINEVAVGVPARKISDKGSLDLMKNIYPINSQE